MEKDKEQRRKDSSLLGTLFTEFKIEKEENSRKEYLMVKGGKLILPLVSSRNPDKLVNSINKYMMSCSD